MMSMSLVWCDVPPMQCSVKDLYGPRCILYLKHGGGERRRCGSRDAPGAWRQEIDDWAELLEGTQVDEWEEMA